VLSSSKKDKAAGIISLGSEILKNLYQSANEDIKVLALVVRVIALIVQYSLEGCFWNRRVSRKLPRVKAPIPVPVWLRKVPVKHWLEPVASQCRHSLLESIDVFSLCRFLTTSASFDVRRWSAAGLAYLTLDADVKEELVDNPSALKALFEICQCQDAHVLYSITTIFVNLTNTYDMRKAEKEMTELANYAKQHVPKEHAKVNDCCWIEVRLQMRF
jgi:hypothetical protein